jgi:hypothetical protein
VHTKLCIDDLQAIATAGDEDKLCEILGQMQRYQSNINGSDGYFAKQQRELESLMESKGTSTLWFTFPAAITH